MNIFCIFCIVWLSYILALFCLFTLRTMQSSFLLFLSYPLTFIYACFSFPEYLAWYSQSSLTQGINRVTLNDQSVVRLGPWIVPEWRVVAGWWKLKTSYRYHCPKDGINLAKLEKTRHVRWCCNQVLERRCLEDFSLERMDLFLESRDYKVAEFAVVPDMSAKSRALYHILEIVLLLATAGIGSWMLQGRQVESQTLSPSPSTMLK